MSINAHTPLARRLLLAGGFALAVAAAPMIAGAHQVAPTPLASCPPGQNLDVLTGACRPGDEAPEPIENPINPEGADLQTGSITSAETGEIGRLPEVNGIPCNGDNTGLCIGLSEQNQSLEGTPSDPFGTN